MHKLGPIQTTFNTDKSRHKFMYLSFYGGGYTNEKRVTSPLCFQTSDIKSSGVRIGFKLRKFFVLKFGA